MKQLFGVHLLGVLWLCGCSQTLDIPGFSIQKPRPIETIVLGNELGPKELKSIFRALNEKGQLNSLKPWFEEAPESALRAWGKFFTRYLYQDAFSSNGLLQILASRDSQKSFSKLNERLSEISETENFKLQKQTLYRLLSDPQSLELIERDAYVLDPKWQEEMSPFFNSLRKNLVTPSSPKELFKDLRSVLSNPEFTGALYPLATHFEKAYLGHNLIRALRNLNPNPESNHFPVFIKNLQRYFKTQANGSTDSQKILALLKILDQPSQGLFLSIEQTLKTETGEELIRLLGERLEPGLLKSLSKSIEDNLGTPFDGQTLTPEFWQLLPRTQESNEPTAQFQHLYRRIYASLTKFTNSNSTESDLILGLNSYVLTRWMETLSSKHPNQIKGEGILKLKIQPFDFSLNLLEIDDKGTPKKDANSKVVLSSSVARDLKALGLTEWTADLEQIIKLQNFGKTLYVVSKSKSNDFSSVLLHTIERCHSIHPFADPVPLFTSLFLSILHADPNKGFNIAQLETSNMLHSSNQFIAGLSLKNLRLALHFATDILQIDRLSSKDTERIRSLVPNNPEALKIIDGLLKNISILRSLDQSENGGISSLSFLHALDRSVPLDSIEGMTELLRFGYRSTLLQTPPDKNPILNLLLTPNFSGNILKALAELNPPTEQAFLKAMRQSFATDSFNRSGLRMHIEFLNPFLYSNEAGILALWDSMPPLKTSTLTEHELNWIFRFVESGSFKELATFLQKHSNQENLFQLSIELERLLQKGGLRDAFTLLGNIKNDRMQRLALVLMQLEKSGELKALLLILNTLTKG